jgi:hypothetical protein
VVLLLADGLACGDVGVAGLDGGGDPGLLRGDQRVDQRGLADALGLRDLGQVLPAVQGGADLVGGRPEDAGRGVEVDPAVAPVAEAALGQRDVQGSGDLVRLRLGQRAGSDTHRGRRALSVTTRALGPH